MKRLPTVFVLSLLAAILSAACSPSADCASEELFCVGLVTEVGSIDNNPLNRSVWDGVQKAEKELGAHVKFLETRDAGEYVGNIASFAEEDYDVIVTVGSALGEATIAASANYPDVDFIGVDQFQTQTADGVAGLNFPEDQAGFLAGTLAAFMSKSQTIGAVCATDRVPYIQRFGEGYKAGAAYADQLKGVSTEVIVVYHGNDAKAFTDPEWGEATARTMLDQDADVIFGCGGTTGNAALITAAEAGIYAIGMDTDQYLILPEAAPNMLTSATRQIESGVFELVRFSKEGTFPSGNYFGKVASAPYHDLEDEIPTAVKAVMEQIKAGLLDGSIQTNIPTVGR